MTKKLPKSWKKAIRKQIELAMSDKPRDWPTKAMNARDKCAEYAISISDALNPFLDDVSMTDEQKVKRVAKAIALAKEQSRILEGLGACTRPQF